MVSFSALTVLALSATTALAYPKAHGAFYGHKRFHGTGMQGTGYAHPTGHHHHTANSTESSISTYWITVTVYPVDSTSTIASATTTAAAISIKNKGVCHGGAGTQTLTDTSTIYVTVTADQNSTTIVSTTTVAPTTLSTSTTIATTTTVAPTTLSTSTIASTTTVAPTTSTSSQAAYSTVDATYTSSTTSAAAVTSSASVYGTAQFYGTAGSQTSSQSASTTISGGSYAGSKKGISFTDAAGLDMLGNSGSSWAYNWGLAPANGVTMPSGVKFVPMCWGLNGASNCAASVKNAISQYGSDTVLSFNEPDMASQSNMSPQDAFQSHVANIVTPLAGSVKIGSPAITNAEDAGKGLDWMKSFLQLCKPDPNGADACKLDFLALHWYAPATSIDYFKSHMTAAIQLAEQYNIPGVWITEFAATDCTDAESASFLSQAMTWLESSDAAKVERYAYFMAGSSQGMGMITNNALNAIGQAYDAVTS